MMSPQISRSKMVLSGAHFSGTCSLGACLGGTVGLRPLDNADHSPSALAGRFRCAASLLLITLFLGVTNAVLQCSGSSIISKYITKNVYPIFKITRNSTGTSTALATASNQVEQCTKVLDMVFVVDESGSVGSHNFKKVRQFLSDFVDVLPVSEDEVHVAAIAYGHKVRELWNFNSEVSISKAQARRQFQDMWYAAGQATMTHTAIDKARALLISSEGAREKVPKVLVLLTDGSSSQKRATERHAQLARSTGIQFFVVGVGNADANECRNVCGCTGKECPQYFSSAWTNLASKVMAMMQEVCKKLPKDAVCSDWSDWSTCSVSCGEGVREKIRTQVSDPLPGDPPCDGCSALVGKTCEELGGLKIVESCFPMECPVDAGCGYWGEWSDLSASCGTATQTRIRMEYNHPPPKGAGLFCEQQTPPVHSEEHRQVELPPCVTETEESWSEWSDCDVTCGTGKRQRTRRRIFMQEDKVTKEEHEHEEEACNPIPCPVDADCGDFGEWTDCSRTCGGGISVRRRDPWLDNQKYGGKTCLQQHPDGREQRKDCNEQACPVNEILGEWLAWGECSVSCGKGFAQRYRSPSPLKAANGGLTLAEQIESGALDAKLEETKECNSFPCGPCTYPFAEWSHCQGTCSTGYRERHTAVKFDYPNQKCALPVYEWEACIPTGCAESAGGGGGVEEAREAGGGVTGGGGAETETPSGQEGQQEREEGKGVPVAAVAGGIVGGALLLGALGAGAYYGLAAKAGATPAAPHADFGEQAPGQAMEEEREAMIGVDEESEMWRS